MVDLNMEIKQNNFKPQLIARWHLTFAADSIFSGAASGAWSTDGCSLLLINTSQVTCQCTHLTNFALLLQVTSESEVSMKAEYNAINKNNNYDVFIIKAPVQKCNQA